jgi:cytochrome c biogenesis protein CcmG, thiol:disulfide interchange protein DsbE
MSDGGQREHQDPRLSATQPPAAQPPAADHPAADHPAAEPRPAERLARPRPGLLRAGRRPSTMVMAGVAVCAALIAAVIAVDSTASHKPRPAAEPIAPPFTLPSLRDPAQQVSLSAYRGQPVIINFFASWCGPCKRETPLLARFYRAVRGSVVIIGVDADDSAAAALRFLKADGVAYPVGFETTPAVTNAYGVSEIGIPETFFLNSKHRIVKRILGDVTMQSLTSGVALIDGGRPPALTAALLPRADRAQDRG